MFRSPLHEMAVGISDRQGLTLIPHVIYLEGGNTAVVTVSDRRNHSDLSLYWRRRYTLPTETSFDSGDETDPEMPALSDDSTIHAEYVGHRFHINDQVIPIHRTSDEHPGAAGYGLEGLEGLD